MAIALKFIADLVQNFDVAEKTPSSFAAAETDLLGTIVRFGRDADLALASEFAADSAMLTVTFEGETKTFQRLEPTTAKVATPFGAGSIERSLYRESGVHNGPTVDPVALRCGLLNSATPRAVQVMAAFVAAVPSREAETLLCHMGIETLSRSRIERTAQVFGERLEDNRDELDTALIEKFDIPAEAVALGVSVDRISIPIEKPLPRKGGRPPKGAARKPVEVVYGIWDPISVPVW